MTIPSNEPNSVYLRLTSWLVFGLYCLIGLAVLLCLQLLFTSYVLNSREHARQILCLYNLSIQIQGVLGYSALNNGQFPPSVCRNNSEYSAVQLDIVPHPDKPNDFSWRVWADILGMVPDENHQKTANQSKTEKPDSRKILLEPLNLEKNQDPDFGRIYFCPNSGKQTIKEKYTSYMYVTGPNCISDGDQSVKTDQLIRGSTYVLTITEVINSTTVWFQPGDLAQSQYNKGSNLKTTELCAGSFHTPKTQRKVNVAFADGRATALRSDIDNEIWQILPQISVPKTEQSNIIP